MERERDWCRHVKVNIASADQQVEREREREMCVCVFFLNIVSLLFFTLGTRLPISKFCVNLCKKYLFVRDVGPRYNISWNSKSTERANAFKEERNSVVIHR